MILDTKRNRSPRLAKTRLGFVTSAAALFAVLASSAGPRLVLAQSDAPAPLNAPPEAGAVALATTPPLPPGVAQNEDPTAPIPTQWESGPRYKPEPPGQPYAPRAIMPALPVTPAPPAPPMAGAAPVRPKGPLMVTRREFALAGKPGEGDPMEERLARLERLVQLLMAQQKGGPAAPDHPVPKPQWNFNYEEKFNFDGKQREQLKDLADRAAGQARAEAQRAQREMDKIVKENGPRAREVQKEFSKHQIEALHQARESLQRQLKQLDSQIQKLEQDQQRQQENPSRRGELKEEQKEATDTSPEAR